jgi:hypothetical protein
MVRHMSFFLESWLGVCHSSSNRGIQSNELFSLFYLVVCIFLPTFWFRTCRFGYRRFTKMAGLPIDDTLIPRGCTTKFSIQENTMAQALSSNAI